MSDIINVKIKKNLAEQVLNLAKKKFPLRNIDNNTEAIREALLDFVKNIPVSIQK